MRWGIEGAGGPLSPAANPTQALFTDHLCPCCPIQSELDLLLLAGESIPRMPLSPAPPKHPGVPRVLQDGPPEGPLARHFSTFPAKKMWELDYSPGSQPFMHGDYVFFFLSETTFTYYKIHHFNHFEVQFSGSFDTLCHAITPS